MSWWNNIVNAVQSYFSPKPAVQSSAPSWNQISSSLGNNTPNLNGISTRGTSVAPVRRATQSSTPRGVAVQGPTYSAPSGGGGNSGGWSSNVPSSSGSAPQPYVPPTPSILSQGISDIKRFASGTPTERQGMVGRGIDVAGTKLGNILPEFNISEKLESQGGYQAKIDEAIRNGWLQNIPEYMTGFQRYGDQANQIFNWMQRNRGGGARIEQQNLLQRLQGMLLQPSNVKTGAAGTLSGAAKTGAVPDTAKTGAPAQVATGVVPSPVTTPRGAVVPSKVDTATLPANMQGLTSTSVNVPLAKAITPEAIQSIGQLLLTSLLGNQSPLTSLSPGIAQALWGAPTAASAFGGYEGGAAVPSQTSIEQPKNLPPVPQALNQG